jgi:hypothetical protein
MNNRRVVVVKPDVLVGKIAILDGDRFKYPGQGFWVQPVILEGKKNLITHWRELTDMDERQIDLPLKINPDPSLVYGYYDVLTRGVCLHCGKPLQWKLEVKENDDRFCYAICCAIRFSMIPDKVKVIAMPDFGDYKIGDEEELADDNFMKALQEMK